MQIRRWAILAAMSWGLTACATLTGGPLIRPGEPVGFIDVVNGSSMSLTSVLISDCSAMSYGLNRLPNGVTIPPGRSYRFTVSAGCWDIGTGLAYHEAYQRITVRPGGGFRWTVR